MEKVGLFCRNIAVLFAQVSLVQQVRSSYILNNYVLYVIIDSLTSIRIHISSSHIFVSCETNLGLSLSSTKPLSLISLKLCHSFHNEISTDKVLSGSGCAPDMIKERIHPARCGPTGPPLAQCNKCSFLRINDISKTRIYQTIVTRIVSQVPSEV